VIFIIWFIFKRGSTRKKQFSSWLPVFSKRFTIQAWWFSSSNCWAFSERATWSI